MGSEILLALGFYYWYNANIHIFTVTAVFLAIFCWLFVHDTPPGSHPTRDHQKPLSMLAGLLHVLRTPRIWVIGFIAAAAFTH